MANKIIGNTYLYNGPGYLDSKIQPVESVSDLNGILLRQRFAGLTVTVLHPDGPGSSPADYWLVQDPNEEEGVLMWVRKTSDATTVDTNTPKYIEVTNDGSAYHVNATEWFDTFESAVTEDIRRIDEKNAEQDALISGNSALYSAITETIERIQEKDAEQDEAISGLTESYSSITETISTIIEKDAEQDRLISGLTDAYSSVTETIVNIQEKDAEQDELISGLTVFSSSVTETINTIQEKDAQQDEEISDISKWHIEKFSSGTSASYYALVDGSGNTIGDTIEVIDEQYLEDVVYINHATAEDKAIDNSVIIGDPYLKFTWKYDIITYVAVKDWVNDYIAGLGIQINQQHEISVKLAEKDEGNQNYLSVDNSGLKMNIIIEVDEL